MHLLAVPAYDQHTAEVIFDTVANALDVFCPSWKDIIICVSTDAERKVTDHISGVLTRFQNVAKPGFIRIWCGVHHLEIVLQSVYRKLVARNSTSSSRV